MVEECLSNGCFKLLERNGYGFGGLYGTEGVDACSRPLMYFTVDVFLFFACLIFLFSGSGCLIKWAMTFTCVIMCWRSWATDAIFFPFVTGCPLWSLTGSRMIAFISSLSVILFSCKASSVLKLTPLCWCSPCFSQHTFANKSSSRIGALRTHFLLMGTLSEIPWPVRTMESPRLSQRLEHRGSGVIPGAIRLMAQHAQPETLPRGSQSSAGDRREGHPRSVGYAWSMGDPQANVGHLYSS